MSSAVEQTFEFSKHAKGYRAKEPTVRAYKHKGAPIQINTEHGAKPLHEGDYAVQTGEREFTETIPPRAGKPGEVKKHKVPVLDVVSAEQFESQYEA